MAKTQETSAQEFKLEARAYPIAEPQNKTLAFASVTVNDIIIRLIKENLNTTLADKEDKKRESLEQWIEEIKHKMINLVKFNTRNPDDQSMYTEEYIKLSHGLAQLSKEKEAYDNADLDRFSKRENAHELIDYLAQTSNNAIGFDDDEFNIMVEKIVFYAPDKMDFILKDGSTVSWGKTPVDGG